LRPTAGSPSHPTDGVNDSYVIKKPKVKLLFVQDPQLLLFTCQDKSSGRSVFRVHVLAPLLYTDAKVDLMDKRRLKVMVRSWKPVSNMQKLDVDFTESGMTSEHDFATINYANGVNNSLYGNVRVGNQTATKPTDCYLKLLEKSQIWQLVVVMDTEQACSLAAQYIEGKRKAITAEKMDKLRSVLSNWAMDSFDSLLEE
jgi:hypothetical protein